MGTALFTGKAFYLVLLPRFLLGTTTITKKALLLLLLRPLWLETNISRNRFLLFQNANFSVLSRA